MYCKNSVIPNQVFPFNQKKSKTLIGQRHTHSHKMASWCHIASLMLMNSSTVPLSTLWVTKWGERADLQNYISFSHQDQKLKYQRVFLVTPELPLNDLENQRDSFVIQLPDKEWCFSELSISMLRFSDPFLVTARKTIPHPLLICHLPEVWLQSWNVIEVTWIQGLFPNDKSANVAWRVISKKKMSICYFLNFCLGPKNRFKLF